MEAKLVLIPTPIAEGKIAEDRELVAAISGIKHFVVERIKTARRFLKSIAPDTVIDELHFFEISKGFDQTQLFLFLGVLKKGESVGLMSEAGCPAIADPGHLAVAWCHRHSITVQPFVGPSSIILALMSSGFNGQQFTFHGYLPNKNPDLGQKIKMLDQNLEKTGTTQVFIETPYRNGFMVQNLIQALHPSRLVCIACDLDSDSQFISTREIGAWKSFDLEKLHKRPAVFLIGKS